MFSRRQFLQKSSMGFGALALQTLMHDPAYGVTPLAAKKTHFEPKAKSVIFLYMDGGVSQVDSFDPKPLLAKENGQKPKFKVDATVFNNNGNLQASPWAFKNYGKSGIPISDLFPHIGSVADELCIIRSMTAFSPNHPNANYALHSGHVLLGRPSMGSWITYGLGTENQNLPGFVVLHGGQVPSGGMQCFSSGFLPSNYEGSVFLPQNPALRNITPHEKAPNLQTSKLQALNEIDADLKFNPAIESGSISMDGGNLTMNSSSDNTFNLYG